MGGWPSLNAGLVGPTEKTAPLSTLLPAAPTPYSNATTPGASSGSKMQYAADILGTEGTKNLGAGTSLLGTPLDYWQNRLKPPTRQGLLEEAAPVVSSVVGQYSTGKKAVSQQPRGGGTAATLANLPFQESGTITGLLEEQLGKKLNTLQPEAANAITQIGQTLNSLGLGELGLSSQDLTSLISAELAKSQQKQGALAGIGKAVGGIISTLLLGSNVFGSDSGKGVVGAYNPTTSMGGGLTG